MIMHLKLNDEKAEFLFIGTRQQLAKVNLNIIQVGNYVKQAQPCVRNLGSWLDATLSMSTHITKVCAAAFCHLHNISRIRPLLSTEDTITLVHAFVTSLLDYCYSLLCGLPARKLNEIQRVFSVAATARLVCCAPCHSRITLFLFYLHWLPVKQRIQFKILLFTFKAINGVTPPYLSEMVTVKERELVLTTSAPPMVHYSRRIHERPAFLHLSVFFYDLAMRA